MPETRANPEKSGRGRSIVYFVVAVVILALIYFAVTSYQAGQTPSPEPASEEAVQAPEAAPLGSGPETPAPEPAPSGSEPETASSEDLETQREDVLSPEFNPFEF